MEAPDPVRRLRENGFLFSSGSNCPHFARKSTYISWSPVASSKARRPSLSQRLCKLLSLNNSRLLLPCITQVIQDAARPIGSSAGSARRNGLELIDVLGGPNGPTASRLQQIGVARDLPTSGANELDMPASPRPCYCHNLMLPRRCLRTLALGLLQDLDGALAHVNDLFGPSCSSRTQGASPTSCSLA